MLVSGPQGSVTGLWPEGHPPLGSPFPKLADFSAPRGKKDLLFLFRVYEITLHSARIKEWEGGLWSDGGARAYIHFGYGFLWLDVNLLSSAVLTWATFP